MNVAMNSLLGLDLHDLGDVLNVEAKKYLLRYMGLSAYK